MSGPNLVTITRGGPGSKRFWRLWLLANLANVATVFMLAFSIACAALIAWKAVG